MSSVLPWFVAVVMLLPAALVSQSAVNFSGWPSSTSTEYITAELRSHGPVRIASAPH